MKIFRFFSNNINDEQSFYNKLAIATIPDTALLIRQRPFFLPDFCENDCMTQLCLCVRINRLGKSIHTKFAHRYYDTNELTLGVHFLARYLLNQLLQAGQPIDLAIGFDNAVAVAEKNGTIKEDDVRCEIRHNETTHNTLMSFKQMQAIIDNEIARISQFYTLRQGDLLLLPLPIKEFQVNIADKLSLTMNNELLLHFDIK